MATPCFYPVGSLLQGLWGLLTVSHLGAQIFLSEPLGTIAKKWSPIWMPAVVCVHRDWARISCQGLFAIFFSQYFKIFPIFQDNFPILKKIFQYFKMIFKSWRIFNLFNNSCSKFSHISRQFSNLGGFSKFFWYFKPFSNFSSFAKKITDLLWILKPKFLKNKS